MADGDVVSVARIHEGDDDRSSNGGVDNSTSHVGSDASVSMPSDRDDGVDVVRTEGGPLVGVLHAVGMQESGHGELAQPWSHGLRTS